VRRGYCISIDNLPNESSYVGNYNGHNILLSDPNAETLLDRIRVFENISSALYVAHHHSDAHPAATFSVRPYLRIHDENGERAVIGAAFSKITCRDR
jgi:hypothetical protein